MKQTSRGSKSLKTKDLPAEDKRKINLSRFPSDLTKVDIISSFKDTINIGPFFAHIIDTLGVAKTVGRGRTNLTFIEPFIVQADATPPRATFDPALSPHRAPAMSMHYEPKAYGFTGVSSFRVIFAIECFGQCSFQLSGFAGGGTLANSGTKVLNGQITVSLSFNNVPANAQVHCALTQTGGAKWDFFTVEIRQPPLLIAKP